MQYNRRLSEVKIDKFFGRSKVIKVHRIDVSIKGKGG